VVKVPAKSKTQGKLMRNPEKIVWRMGSKNDRESSSKPNRRPIKDGAGQQPPRINQQKGCLLFSSG